MRDELRRMALFGSGIAELTRNRAEEIVRDFFRTGDERRQQASNMARMLVELSRANRRELLQLVRSEIQTQLDAVQFASRRDLQRLERRVARLEGSTTAARTAAASPRTPSGRGDGGPARRTAAADASSSPKTPAGRTAAARATAATRGSTTAKKTAARKTAARKTAARKTAARKTTPPGPGAPQAGVPPDASPT